MPTVEITVNGRRHIVQCGEGEEQRLRDLAAYVDARVQELARRHGGFVGDSRLLVLVALLLADELDDTCALLKARERELAELRTQLEALRREVASDRQADTARLAVLAERLEALAARLDAV